MDHHADKFGDMSSKVGDLRGEMRQFHWEMGQLRSEIHGFRDDMNRGFDRIHQRFAWLFGIQMATLITIIGGLVGALYR